MTTTMTRAIRVLVVDDSAFMRQAIASMLREAGDIEVIDTARDGLEGVEKAKALDPEVVTLDVEMPGLDGLTALKQILKVSRARVLMVSSQTTEGSAVTLRALSSGADDFVSKNASQVSFEILKVRDELIAKVRALGEAGRSRKAGSLAPASAIGATAPGPTPAAHKSPAGTIAPRPLRGQDYDAVLIGSSTGGPQALERVITALPSTFPLPVVVAQHMPALFTRSMAERLASLARVRVVEAEDDMIAQPGWVYIGPGGRHVRLRRPGAGVMRLEVGSAPAQALYKPSVDELFASAARAIGRRTLAIVLTGMGRDGADGAASLAKTGATILAQDHASCVVYGMPKAVTEAGLASQSLPPEEIGKLLARLSTGA